MSGGFFDYQQYKLLDFVSEIENYLYGYDLDDEDVDWYINDRFLDSKEKEYLKNNKHTLPNRYHFSEETLKEFQTGIDIIKKAYVYAQRIDWLLSGDDGEEEFHNRLKEDLNK